ncbi:phenylacetate-CoA ligase [Methylohalomonas lacus]|uniref:Phenylacetate-CoA ligase n=1 Tax=Methylohalomonas lacus TaxID=398773 RepID=A0AAE3HL36_9GAMM|nr:hypothetical protein [Methylohalomonas lacus]MCS3904326.1 phenylacetate-CoA ligase [Methylohalomonas lacus]
MFDLYNINTVIYKYLVYNPVLLVKGQWLYPYLSELNKTQYTTSEVIEELQSRKLKKLLNIAKSNTLYYKEINYDPELPINDILNSIPILNKETLKINPDQLINKKFNKSTTRKISGGSTGTPVSILKNNKAMAQELAAAWRGYEWAGVGIGSKQARFWGVPITKYELWKARLIDLITNRKRFSAFKFSDVNLRDYIKVLDRFKPLYFYGYTSMLKQLALFLQRENILLKFKPVSVISTAELLSEEDRALFKKYFKSNIFNEYGCGEVGTIAHECENGSLHINSENLILETVDDNGDRVDNGEIGNLLVTDLNNLAMPLIRYRLGDKCILSSDKCDCGRTLPVLKKIVGREYDFLVNKSGEYFHGEYFLYLFEELKRKGIVINSYQVIQTSPDNIDIYLNISTSLDKIKKYITKHLQKDFGYDIKINYHMVDELILEKSGKIRLIKKDF